MDTIGPTILKQLQALSARANTLFNRIVNDSLPTGRMLEREVRDAEGDLESITSSFDRDEEKLMNQADQAMEELTVTR